MKIASNTSATQPKKTPCFPHRHMTCRQFGLWTRIRELQSKFGFVWFDGDDLARSFASEPSKAKTPKVAVHYRTGKPMKPRRYGASRDAIYADCDALLTSGWFEELQARARKKDGTWEARKLQALTHKEWAAKYPTKCKELQDSQSASSPLDTLSHTFSPVGKERLTSEQGAIDQLARSDSPVSKERLTSEQVAHKDLVQSRHGSESDRVQNDLVHPRGKAKSKADLALHPKPEDDINSDEYGMAFAIQYKMAVRLKDGTVFDGRTGRPRPGQPKPADEPPAKLTPSELEPIPLGGLRRFFKTKKAILEFMTDAGTNQMLDSYDMITQLDRVTGEFAVTFVPLVPPEV